MHTPLLRDKNVEAHTISAIFIAVTTEEERETLRTGTFNAANLMGTASFDI